MAMSKADLKNAFREVAALEFAHIPQDENSIDYTFSESFNRKMERLIKSQQRSYWQLVNTASKRAAVIIFAVLTMFTTATFSVKAIREPVVKFITEVYETFTHYFFAGDTTDVITKEYVITRLPDGFVQTDKIIDSLLITTTYQNSAGDIIKFTQQATKNAGHTFDNENGKVTTITVSDRKVDIHRTDGITHALWSMDGCYFKLSVFGNVDIEEIKLMLESME